MVMCQKSLLERVGFLFKKGGDKLAKNKPKAVYQIDAESDKVVKRFDSVSQASKHLGNASCRASITLVCRGYQKTAYGYKWQYAD